MSVYMYCDPVGMKHAALSEE